MAELFSDPYKEQVFFLWHEGGRKISNKFTNTLPEENGNKPSPKTIEKWRDGYGWIQRAEVLDSEISQHLQENIINKRVEMYEEHVKVANALIQKGKEFLESHDLKDSSDALKAIALGIEIERNSVGQADIGRKVLKMTNEQLEKELLKLIGQTPPGDDEFIEVEAEEVD